MAGRDDEELSTTSMDVVLLRGQTQRLGLRLGIVAGANSSATSIDVALSTSSRAARHLLHEIKVSPLRRTNRLVARQWTCHHYSGLVAEHIYERVMRLVGEEKVEA